jgi:hypothetical protein
MVSEPGAAPVIDQLVLTRMPEELWDEFVQYKTGRQVGKPDIVRAPTNTKENQKSRATPGAHKTTETDLHAMAAHIAQLKDEKKMTWAQIANELQVSKSELRRLYQEFNNGNQTEEESGVQQQQPKHQKNVGGGDQQNAPSKAKGGLNSGKKMKHKSTGNSLSDEEGDAWEPVTKRPDPDSRFQKKDVSGLASNIYTNKNRLTYCVQLSTKRWESSGQRLQMNTELKRSDRSARWRLLGSSRVTTNKLKCPVKMIETTITERRRKRPKACTSKSKMTMRLGGIDSMSSMSTIRLKRPSNQADAQHMRTKIHQNAGKRVR